MPQKFRLSFFLGGGRRKAAQLSHLAGFDRLGGSCGKAIGLCVAVSRGPWGVGQHLSAMVGECSSGTVGRRMRVTPFIPICAHLL